MSKSVSELTFRQATSDDGADLSTRLRHADLEELKRSQGRWLNVEQVLRASVRTSDLCWAGEDDGRVIMLFGVVGHSLLGEHGPIGVPWMLGSDEVLQHSKAMVKKAREFVELMHARYPYLVNYVDRGNTVSKRWLRRMGFVLYPAVPFGMEHKPFHRFDKLKRPADV